MNKILRFLMGVIAIGIAVAFLAVPVIKLKDPALLIVIVIGVAAMIYNFIEVMREKED